MAAGDGVSLREHYEAIEAQGGKVKELEDLRDYPDALHYIMQWFADLASGRQFTESGPCPISFNDIMDYKTLYRVDMHPWEVRAIKALDSCYLRVSRDWIRKKS